MEDRAKSVDDELKFMKKDQNQNKGGGDNTAKNIERLLTEMDKLERQVNELTRNNKGQEEIKKALAEFMEKINALEFENEKKFEE